VYKTVPQTFDDIHQIMHKILVTVQRIYYDHIRNGIPQGQIFMQHIDLSAVFKAILKPKWYLSK